MQDTLQDQLHAHFLSYCLMLKAQPLTTYITNKDETMGCTMLKTHPQMNHMTNKNRTKKAQCSAVTICNDCSPSAGCATGGAKLARSRSSTRRLTRAPSSTPGRSGRSIVKGHACSFRFSTCTGQHLCA